MSARIECLAGMSGGRRVLSGFAPSSLLARLSFADRQESAPESQARRADVRRSLDFRRHIQQPGASARPLTFSLRPEAGARWRLEELAGERCVIVVDDSRSRVLSQLDCSHHLAHLADLDVALPFMAYLGLTPDEERCVREALDDTTGTYVGAFGCRPGEVCGDLAADRPDMYVALILRNDPISPWYRELDLGDRAVSGLSRRASLRTMCKGARPVVAATAAHAGDVDVAAANAIAFWCAVRAVLPDQWLAPRRHMLNKGIGVYALMQVAADMLTGSASGRIRQREFEALLADFVTKIDWTSSGPLAGLNGEAGIAAAVTMLRSALASARGE